MIQSIIGLLLTPENLILGFWVEKILKKYKPDRLGIETLFFNKNVKRKKEHKTNKKKKRRNLPNYLTTRR
jgi:hypothetical protein